MTPCRRLPSPVRPIVSKILACGCLAALLAVRAHAAPAVKAPYQLSVFAQSENGYSQPDSIVQWQDSVVVGFQNHVAKDGTDGKSSTIVQYDLNGRVQRTFSVPGHNDGLRIIAGTNDLWCIQNEDANPNLVVIDLGTGRRTSYTFAPTLHGGGFDDIVELDGRVFLTASNPNLNGAGVNVFPALDRATLPRHGHTVELEPVLAGNANAIDLPTGADVQLNLTDPDSMTLDLRGNIVFTSQADGELVFVRDPLTANQAVGRLQITLNGAMTTLDDTAFAPNLNAFLLFTDVSGDTVYRLDRAPFGFEPGTAYSGSDTAAVVGVLDLDDGVLTPVATGFGSVRGLVFVTHTR